MSIIVVAEKPSVARDIARVLGATRKQQGYLEGNGYQVTWAIGHLVTLAEPAEINAAWKKWRLELLPMLPSKWPLVVIEKTKDQFQTVKKLLTGREVEHVVCATDAGREGELIYRYIHEAAKCRKSVKRLWISSLTDQAIRDGFKNLRNGSDYDGLADAARGRSCADWLVGMNLSRAYGLSLDAQLSVGRVQTPTLAMVVQRELAIRDFVPESYREVVATFAGESARYDGTWIRPAKKGETAALAQRKRISDEVEANAIVERVTGGKAEITSVKRKTKRMPPPQLYDLTELQRHANRLFGFTAKRTLEIAQKLYETHKVLSYPRTDSRHLSKALAGTLSTVVRAIRAPYEKHIAPETGREPLGKRHVDDTKITDHHAIIPTDRTAGNLGVDERRIYDLVCRRLLQAWHGDFVWGATTVLTTVRPTETDVFHSSGTVVEDQGWKVLDLGGGKRVPKQKKSDNGEPDEPEKSLPSGLEKGQLQEVVDAKAVEKQTRPPPRLNDATLLTAMETAGRTLDEKELSRAMKDSGLGTPATRAAIIETLLQRDYVVRQGKALVATDKGIGLIDVVDETVKSPLMTGQWESRLQAIERKNGDLSSFVDGIELYVRDVVGRVPAVHSKRLPAAEAHSQTTSSTPLPPPSLEKRPREGEQLGALLKRVYGFDSFRPHQEAVCRAATKGDDVLLVMPTGAGKSLCYQLPGLARGGTTLVVSPLIALIEDQVAKLRALGLNAERIHSGLGRLASREVCRQYLDGALDYLFIAPERLGVPGFPEMLAKRTPSLVAIDEAHCISQWGHDFRPDYRLLGQRLPLLRPAPIVAATATATPVVQRDIMEQLGLESPRPFIHGFRRTNLAIEVREAGPSERIGLAKKLLTEADRLPAIVYSPTRKKADAAAGALGRGLRAAAYHAGMTASARETVHRAFSSGELDIVVATVAFGMGVDKANVRTVVHLALPGSVEAYYQEIGRAGRDGAQSCAVLLHSYADRHTHQFFLERDYPQLDTLQSVFDALSARAIKKETLRRKTELDSDTLDKVLEKLWMSGAAVVTPDEDVQRGNDGWQQAYKAQRDHRAQQVVLMGRYTEAHGCRMLHLVRHFGDTEDSGESCGICDVCAPTATLAIQHRSPTAQELKHLSRTLELLREQDRQSTGRLSKQVLGEQPSSRRVFEKLLGGLVRASLVTLADDVFETEGRKINFRRACLTPLGRKVRGEEALEQVLLPADAAPDGPRRGGGRKRTRKGRASGNARKRKRMSKSDEPKLETPLANELRAWRLAQAKRRRVPAFRVFTDKILAALCEARPTNEAALMGVPGVGKKLMKKSGPQLIEICRKHSN